MKNLPKLTGLFLGVLLAGGAPCRAAEQRVAPEHPLRDLAMSFSQPTDLDPLIEAASQARVVLLGEASHGTSEFYTTRDAITRRLIADHGFQFVAVEGDWNALYRLNQYVKGHADAGESAEAIMRNFSRWPTWMWANAETAALIEWLRTHNQTLPAEQRVGFYGIDVYGQDDALTDLPQAIQRFDEDLAAWVRERYECLLPFASNIGAYIQALRAGMQPCADATREVVERLREDREALDLNEADYIHLKQMAWVVKNAEKHVRAMGDEGPSSWNFRVDHFFQTVERLMNFYGPDARGIVWAHNTHIGDARATSMAQGGQRNIGQLARQRWPDSVYAIGLGTYKGTVIAGRQWGGPRNVMTVPEAGPGSFEALLHGIGPGNHLLFFRDAPSILHEPIGHRAIGVIYHPEREFPGNYVPTLPAQRYDAFLFFEETKALKPLHP